ncbi:phage terminase large subunit [Wenxinia marina]|uniref:Phage uncharacterized protein (Putative large terminase) n=1 Tax=Wenxinia marina DSM 24838 TaxID=1123501 RepID=A0A0D0Q729_9RHOB|nr:phage terminase large subunit [Wenxinia marina]KIQ70194.1 phage uncharacterized protein (putative large terminase) [Wenxinia marina DSM 24838]GGL50713.1 hypothetical protein GCM10011392_01040 [Wenxinia marina]
MSDLDPRLARQFLQAQWRNDFALFVQQVFHTLHQGSSTPYVASWHIDAMCHELDLVRFAKNRRLVINVPPRCLKSITVAVAYVAFLLGHDPHLKIIVASYGFDLARKHSEDCRKVMMSRWYEATFPGTRLAARGNTADEFKTTKGGGRKAVSIGSSVTGHGADYIIIDDLMKAADARSEAELLRAQDFMEGTLFSRFDRPAQGRVVMIAQRLHERDPAGYLLDKGTYRHLCLPAIAEEEQVIELDDGRVHVRKPGDLLSPEHLPRETLDEMRRDMGTAVFNCQYQQNPIAPDGSVLRWEWFVPYDEPGPRETFQLLVQSWDTGTSADPRSDFSVCTTWGHRDARWYLLDLWRDRLDFPDLKYAVLRQIEKWRPDKVLIEDAASGRPLLQEFRLSHRRLFYGVTPDLDKEMRFAAACAPIEAGLVLLPREAPWLADFKRELQSFPRGRNDDQVDTVSQFLNWTKTVGLRRALSRASGQRGESVRRNPVRRKGYPLPPF